MKASHRILAAGRYMRTCKTSKNPNQKPFLIRCCKEFAKSAGKEMRECLCDPLRENPLSFSFLSPPLQVRKVSTTRREVSSGAEAAQPRWHMASLHQVLPVSVSAGWGRGWDLAFPCLLCSASSKDSAADKVKGYRRTNTGARETSLRKNR